MTEQDAPKYEQGIRPERYLGNLDLDREITTAIYSQIIDLGHDAAEGMEEDPSVKKILLHQVLHSLLRIEAFTSGGFGSYEYEKVNPEGFKKIKDLSAEELLKIHQENTQKLKEGFSRPDIRNKIFNLPSGSASGLEMLIDTAGHEEYHSGELKQIATFLKLERVGVLDKRWGPKLKK